MKNEGQEYVRKKVNLLGVVVLLGTIVLAAYATVSPQFVLSGLESETGKNVRDIAKGDEEMLKNPAYIRLNEYGRGLSAAAAFLEYKDANPTWYQFLSELSNSVPGNVTIRQLQYEPAKKQVFVNLLAPERSRVIQAMSELEDNQGLKSVDFDAITEEKVTFPWDKTQRAAYSAVARFSVDEEYLKEKFEFAHKLRGKRSETAEVESSSAMETGALSGSGGEAESGSWEVSSNVQ